MLGRAQFGDLFFVPIDLPLLLKAYASGIFPMADRRDYPDSFWVEPRDRAILPLDGLRVSKSLAKVIRQDRFRVTSDQAFADVIALCAEQTGDRRETWINKDIEQAFLTLHERGLAHSVECWDGERLVGGLYGRAFCGESMFAKVPNASKVAFVKLVDYLRENNYKLLDCQVHNDHLESLGAFEIPRELFMQILKS